MSATDELIWVRLANNAHTVLEDNDRFGDADCFRSFGPCERYYTNVNFAVTLARNYVLPSVARVTHKLPKGDSVLFTVPSRGRLQTLEAFRDAPAIVVCFKQISRISNTMP